MSFWNSILPFRRMKQLDDNLPEVRVRDWPMLKLKAYGDARDALARSVNRSESVRLRLILGSRAGTLVAEGFVSAFTVDGEFNLKVTELTEKE